MFLPLPRRSSRRPIRANLLAHRENARPQTSRSLDDLSGCYDYVPCNDWDYNECRPRRRRHRKKRYNDCWDYKNYCS
ncbi:hypothetical protein CryarDRAFT_3128 [Cryptosporangium arvum DSM 44712]|uniref:Uncharacterized protein n=1 Tax=Cryptosporangium arvum DSM 44712 TaxID=927661 RepID=A0A010ZTG7_9ACTN|nr:hypothetical protein CryarDRAFT_3128 [Cryptosporangium arvum DSM 44712]